MANSASKDNNGDEKKDDKKIEFGNSSGDDKGKEKKLESPDLNLPMPTTPSQAFSSVDKGKSVFDSENGSSSKSDLNPNPNLESEGCALLMKRRAESEKETDDQDESDGYGLHSGSMMLTVCPGCFQYLLIPKEEPECPKCAMHVPVPGKKKPKIDLNSTSN